MEKNSKNHREHVQMKKKSFINKKTIVNIMMNIYSLLLYSQMSRLYNVFSVMNIIQ
jgi:hypothetical protein